MSDAEEERLLAAARRQWSPTPADAERVLRAATLAVGAVAPAAIGGKLVASATARWIASLLLAVATAGTGGYALGYRTAQHQRTPAPVVAKAPALAPTDVSLPAPAPEPFLPPPAARVPLRNQRQAASWPADFDPAPSLEAETRAMRRIESALRDQKPDLALRLLAQLEQAPGPGQLMEERLAATAVARCAKQPDPERSREFAARFPQSVYRGRVERACRAAVSGEDENSP